MSLSKISESLNKNYLKNVFLLILLILFVSKSAILSSPATRVGLIYININVFYPRNSNLTLPGPENLLKAWKTSTYCPKTSIFVPKVWVQRAQDIGGGLADL